MIKTKTGVAFPDYVSLEKGGRRFRGYDNEKSSIRELFLILSMLLVFGILFGKLFYVQIIQGAYYRDLADNNRTRTVVIHAPRGIIFDRNNTPLVFNIPGFRKVESGRTTFLTKDQAILMIAKGEKNLEVDSLRQYPYKDILGHAIGYIGQISKDELTQPQFQDYRSGDIVGKMGVEGEYESKLKGTDEKQLVEVDSLGKVARRLGQTDPIPGENVKATIDLPTQKAAFEAMKDIKKGAVIASTPTGEILAIISKPSFDPNLFTLGSNYKSDGQYKTLTDVLLDNKKQPLLNRAISGTYPPGSTFKLIVASAGLESGIIDENYQVEDTGVVKIGEFSFANWFFTGYGRTDGMVNVVKGIQRSNDIFFYKLAEKVGVSKISQWAQKYGLGKPLGIDLEGESAGLVPTPDWKEKKIGEPWYLGDTYHYGIGQGYLLTTPLQVNGWTQAIANGGKLYEPHLLMDQKPKILSENLLTDQNFSLIRQGMVEACSTGGVAWPLFDFKIKNPELKIDGKNFIEDSSGSAKMTKVVVACKTGTAEHGDSTTMPHAWITLFAPAYDPQIIVTVLAEDSGEGSNIAAPIAKKILESWFSK